MDKWIDLDEISPTSFQANSVPDTTSLQSSAHTLSVPDTNPVQGNSHLEDVSGT